VSQKTISLSLEVALSSPATCKSKRKSQHKIHTPSLLEKAITVLVVTQHSYCQYGSTSMHDPILFHMCLAAKIKEGTKIKANQWFKVQGTLWQSTTTSFTECANIRLHRTELIDYYSNSNFGVISVLAIVALDLG
jgi:hypothetical protein